MVLNFFNIEKHEPKIVNIDKPILFVGLKTKTSDKKIRKDAFNLGKRFKEISDSYGIPNKKEPRVFLAVTQNYNPNTGTMEYIIGDVVSKISNKLPKELSVYKVPPAKYAVFLIKPKALFLWGYTLGKMKRYIYNE